ncbi:MAG: hypothetical protein ACI89X_001245 [Planctomycetota bacterium]|jgi:hypothetical protein
MMKRLLLSLPVLFLVACGAKEDHNNDKGHGEDDQQEAKHDDGKDGDKGHEEAGHDEGAGEGGHGEHHPLGKMKAHGREFSITQMGDMHAGEEGAVEIEFASAADRIATTRGWIGIESGVGSAKAMLDLEGTATLHGHLDVPSPIPAGSKLWFSFDIDGKVETHSIAYK